MSKVIKIFLIFILATILLYNYCYGIDLNNLTENSATSENNTVNNEVNENTSTTNTSSRN